MQALSEKLQGRLDTFHHKFGKGAEEEGNRIWIVTNITKPEHERVPTTINGTVIDNFIFSGDHEIEFAGYAQPKDTADRLEDRRQKRIDQAKREMDILRGDAQAPELDADSDQDAIAAVAEMLAETPSAKKVKQKE